MLTNDDRDIPMGSHFGVMISSMFMRHSSSLMVQHVSFIGEKVRFMRSWGRVAWGGNGIAMVMVNPWKLGTVKARRNHGTSTSKWGLLVPSGKLT